MDDLIIYKSLSFLKSGSDIISDQLLKKSFFKGCDLDSVNDRYSKLLKMGYCAGSRKGDIITLRLTAAGKSFLADWKYRSCINVRNSVVSYLAGIVSGVIISYLIPYLLSL